MTDQPLRIAVLCGSLRGEASLTARALRLVVEEIEAAGAEVDYLDLGALDLPFCQSAADTEDHPGTTALRERVTGAQAVLLGSPEYHNSFSGVLKNALDLLSSRQLGGKLIGLVGVGGGEMGAVNTLGHLRYVVRGVGGWSLPAQLSIPNANHAFDGDRLRDPALHDRVRGFARELVRYARLHQIEPALTEGRVRVQEEDPEK